MAYHRNVKPGKPAAKRRACKQAVSAPTGGPHRRSVHALLLIGVALLVIAAWVWREPLELWSLSRGPLEGLERYVQRNPSSTGGAEALGTAYLRAGRPQDAVRVLEPVLERAPADASLRVLFARALLETGKTADAYAHLQVVLNTLSPGHVEARWWLGQVLERSGRKDEAYDQYEALVRKQPRHAPALLRLGFLAMEDGRTTAAETFFRRAAEADPRSAPAAAHLAEVLFRLGRAEAAAVEARRGVRLAPGDGKANYWLGRSLLALDPRAHGAEAEAAFRRVIAGGVEPYTARYFLAKLLWEQGRTEEAARELEINTRENPLHKDSYYDLALCARSLGQTARAEAAMARFRRLQSLEQEGAQLEYRVWAEPGNLDLRLKLVRFYLRHRRPDLAQPQVQQILDRVPGHPEARRLAAEIAANPQPSL
jgi:tetratricopeptide (TPR) repeat protein